MCLLFTSIRSSVDFPLSLQNVVNSERKILPWVCNDPRDIPLRSAFWDFQRVVPLARDNTDKASVAFALAATLHLF